MGDLGFPRCRCLGAFGLVFAFAFSDVAYVAGESFGIGNGVNVDVAVALEVEVGMGIRSWLRMCVCGVWACFTADCRTVDLCFHLDIGPRAGR